MKTNIKNELVLASFLIKSSLDFESVPLSTMLIKNAIYPAVRTMDRYLPALMRVIYGGQSAEEAIAEIEE